MPAVVLEQLSFISSDKKKLETYKVSKETLKLLKEIKKEEEKECMEKTLQDI